MKGGGTTLKATFRLTPDGFEVVVTGETEDMAKMMRHVIEATRGGANDVEVLKGGAMTKKDQLLAVLSDGEWHDAAELASVVSHRFGAYVLDLRSDGYRIARRLRPVRPKGRMALQYRLEEVDDAQTA